MEHGIGQLGSGKTYRPITDGEPGPEGIAIGVDASRLLEELAAMPCPTCPHLIARHSLAGECADCDCHGCVSVAFVEPDEPDADADEYMKRPGVQDAAQDFHDREPDEYLTRGLRPAQWQP